MKPCTRCRCIHADDYMGTCTDCGAPMGSQNGAASGPSQQDLAFRYVRQNQSGLDETASESSLKRGDYSRVKIEDRLLEVAKGGAFLLEQVAGRKWDENGS